MDCVKLYAISTQRFINSTHYTNALNLSHFGIIINSIANLNGVFLLLGVKDFGEISSAQIRIYI